jgi:hypothetical protein
MLKLSENECSRFTCLQCASRTLLILVTRGCFGRYNFDYSDEVACIPVQPIIGKVHQLPRANTATPLSEVWRLISALLE